MMLRINLLAVKAAKKHVSARQEMLGAVGIVVATLAGLYVWGWTSEAELREKRDRIEAVRQEIAQLKRDVVRVEDFKSKADLLEKKLAAIGKLQNMRFGPAKVLDELATILTEHKKVWLTKLQEKDGTLTLTGAAMEHENISDFHLALERRVGQFKNIKLGPVRAVTKEGVTYHEWSLTCAANYAG
ncbi:MAG: PilN domain-containing protein [Deltaproteobacteria bacterium]|nr:PilN domain-containing protein [Deltaproteobacteria bacterium]